MAARTRKLSISARQRHGRKRDVNGGRRARLKGTARWSRHVMETSSALDLERGVFTGSDPKAMARSLKRSAEQSRRRKSDPFCSAMSMLTFYVNRAGRNLSFERRRVLERAKEELRVQFHRPRSRAR